MQVSNERKTDSPDGEVTQSASFTILSQEPNASFGGLHFSFSAGVSMFVLCTTQAEVDNY